MSEMKSWPIGNSLMTLGGGVKSNEDFLRKLPDLLDQAIQDVEKMRQLREMVRFRSCYIKELSEETPSLEAVHIPSTNGVDARLDRKNDRLIFRCGVHTQDGYRMQLLALPVHVLEGDQC